MLYVVSKRGVSLIPLTPRTTCHAVSCHFLVVCLPPLGCIPPRFCTAENMSTVHPTCAFSCLLACHLDVDGIGSRVDNVRRVGWTGMLFSLFGNVLYLNRAPARLARLLFGFLRPSGCRLLL